MRAIRDGLTNKQRFARRNPNYMRDKMREYREAQRGKVLILGVWCRWRFYGF